MRKEGSQRMKVGIIGAMDVEVAHLIGELGPAAPEPVRAAGMEFHEGELGGTSVVVVKSGVGKVDAAVCAEVLASRFGVTHVINTGVAGSLNNALDICDVLVSRDAIHHDVDATNFGYAPGEVPGLGTVAFEADPALRRAAVEAVAAVAPDSKAVEGRVASGDQFVRDDSEKARIRDTFAADCCEMEGASIAQACWLNHVPFVIVRAISDKADGSDAMDYPTFERRAADLCARIVDHMVSSLGSKA